MSAFPVSPLSLDSQTRDYYGAFDAAIIAQLAPLAEHKCYQPKLYRAPSMANEFVPGNGYASYGLKITPGALICCFYLPPARAADIPGSWNVQIRDESLKHNWFDQPVPSYFLANCKPTFVNATQAVIGSAPNFLVAPYPVVGNGLFLVEFWELSGASHQRIELVFGVLEPIGEACL
jgi:hypothetical protein